MSNKRPAQYTRDDVINLYGNLVDVIIVVDKITDKYRAVIRRGMFIDLIDEEGD